MEIRLAETHDLEDWMALVKRVRDSFPGLETEEALAAHRQTVTSFLVQDGALCAKAGDRLVGALLFSRAAGELCFLAVDPEYRRQHIGEALVAGMLSRMEPGRDITVTTYRVDDPRGTAARAFYRKLGFTDGPLAEEFGTPVQELILDRGQEPSADIAADPDCPCKKKNCPRHGDCVACRSYHAASRRQRPCYCQQKKHGFFPFAGGRKRKGQQDDES